MSMTKESNEIVDKKAVDNLFSAGAHFGFSKSRRHPSVAPFIFGKKNNVEIFDLEKTVGLLEEAKKFVSEVASKGQQVLFVTGKKHISPLVKDVAMKIGEPYVVGRWIGGTLTNFEEIGKRVKRLETLLEEKEKGQLAKYTKKERLLIDREIEKLTERFGGIVDMKKKPGAVVIVDTKEQDNATREAKIEKIPVVGICGSDCDISDSDYPVLANDSAVKSVGHILDELASAYTEGAKKKQEEKKD